MIATELCPSSITDALFTLLVDRLARLEEDNPAMLDAWLSAEDLLGSSEG
ncbi:MAG: hypothetical protein ACRELF_00445 [Gemmataceae bacterium]